MLLLMLSLMDHYHVPLNSAHCFKRVGSMSPVVREGRKEDLLNKMVAFLENFLLIKTRMRMENDEDLQGKRKVLWSFKDLDNVAVWINRFGKWKMIEKARCIKTQRRKGNLWDIWGTLKSGYPKPQVPSIHKEGMIKSKILHRHLGERRWIFYLFISYSASLTLSSPWLSILQTSLGFQEGRDV